MRQSPDPAAGPVSSSHLHVEDLESQELSLGWQAARSAPDLHPDAAGIDELSWLAARVPGTAAAALHDAGLWRAGDPYDFDAEDWWFRTSFHTPPLAPGEEARLRLDGIATVAQVFLNGELVLESDSMFAAHAIDVTERLGDVNELAIRCRALAPLLSVRRRPRARWRTRLVAEGNLRFFRTMLLGRCPGIAPGPASVGPWRAVRLERRRLIEVQDLTLRPRLEGEEGLLTVHARLRPLNGQTIDSVEVELSGPSGSRSTALGLLATESPDGDPLAADGDCFVAHGQLSIPSVARWWPHTHGEPVLHDVRLRVGLGEQSSVIGAGRIGFRDLAFGARPGHEVERDGIDLHVNGVRVFARGAVWTPIDPIGLAPSEEELRGELTRVRDAGMNMLRIPGTGAYETSAFHDLCDQLGILVWQDFMFANLDYPIADAQFRATVEREAAAVLAALGGRPSLAVLCGNSEVEQQVAMTGLDPSLGRGELFGELLPALVGDSSLDSLYLPSAPCGDGLPFRTDRGVGTYYGVGCYRLPLEDARRAHVRFAAECLAFSHIPTEASIEAMAQTPEQLVGNHPVWKAGVPRENGADWDFEDVRDYYLELLLDVDAAELRWVDHARYLELSRALTGEIFAEVFGEWRRAESPCGGALVLWLHDLLPGAGWGLIDHRGSPKLAYHHLKRALAPVAVWLIDEQLGGVVAHVANDRPTPLSASLRVALYREHEHLVEQACTPVELAAHSQGEWNLETVIGRFLDAGWTYRFAQPGHDTIVVTLQADDSDGASVLSQAMRFPAGRPLEREAPERLGLVGRAQTLPDGDARLTLSSARLAYGVRIHAPGFLPSDDGFSIEPGGEYTVTLRSCGAQTALNDLRIGAVNMSGRVKIALG